jgi:16S rRNA (guanine966-N2)-methyltransferase
MKLRIIGGTLGGTYLTVSAGDFRPTSQQCREAVANIVRDRIEGAAVADICAGSGAFGFEMISRGAKSVDFVEKDRRRFNELRAAIDTLELNDRCAVFCDDAVRFAERQERRYDICYFDPPYDDARLQTLPAMMTGLLAPAGILIYERRAAKHRSPAPEAGTAPYDSREYGDTRIEFYRRSDPSDAAPAAAA